ncbi:MAG: adenylosuccinate synthetase, partial [Candidatus Methanodesulfokora sp.]
MPATVVVGGFYGDEGKGKILSYLSVVDDVDLGVRGGVGPNAGHTVVFKGKEFKLRQIPSAFVNERTLLLIGPGVLINPEVLF